MKITYASTDEMLARLKARSPDPSDVMGDLIEVFSRKDNLYHVLKPCGAGWEEVCNSLSSILNLFLNPSSVKSVQESKRK